MSVIAAVRHSYRLYVTLTGRTLYLQAVRHSYGLSVTVTGYTSQLQALCS